MPTNNIILVKYIFLDVVAYTKRTIEAQCYIIEALNRIVKGTINRYHVDEDSYIYIPTGDGMCIALISTNLLYDIHVTIAKEILRRIHVNNSRVKDNWKEFEVRVGINQCDDNIITDINGRKNVTGAGINNARRIMDLADASQILVSSIVYENLHPRKKYYHAFSTEFTKEVKHGLILKIHQLVTTNTTGLNVNTPSSFVTQVRAEPKLTVLSAYYFAHALKNEKFIMNTIKELGTYYHNWLKLLLWFLARDSEHVSETTPHDVWGRRIMPDNCPDTTIEEQFKWFVDNITGDLAIELVYAVEDHAVPSSIRSKYLPFSGDALIVNSEGKKKLKRDWPEIWDEFKLDEVSG